MKKAVFVTAVSGSGKTTVCKALAELGYEAYDIESIPGLFSLVDEDTGQIISKEIGDLKEGLNADWVCDIQKLKTIIINQKAEIAFYCGGTSRTEELMVAFDCTIVLQVSDETTRARLATRGAGEFGSTETVRDWVISWKHRVESDWLSAGGISVNAEPEPSAVAQNIIDRFANGSQ
ncbi:MAG TPA: AAA family ATPase [Candidatus Saccharimonadia bacterium]|nr:AAA family ATPase [Candidatus Saccharimonadia bacterium]